MDEQLRDALRLLDVVIARRDEAYELLGVLVAIVSRSGGYLSAEDQAWLRAARATLAEAGLRVPG